MPRALFAVLLCAPPCAAQVLRTPAVIVNAPIAAPGALPENSPAAPTFELPAALEMSLSPNAAVQNQAPAPLDASPRSRLAFEPRTLTAISAPHLNSAFTVSGPPMRQGAVTPVANDDPGPTEKDLSPTLSGARAAMAQSEPPLNHVYDQSDDKPRYSVSVFPSAFSAGYKGHVPAASSEDRAVPNALKKEPEKPSEPTPAQYLAMVYNLYHHQKLGDAQRAQVAVMVQSAGERGDFGFLESLTFLSLHDARTHTLATSMLRSFRSNERALHALRAEDAIMSRMQGFPDIQRREMVEDLRARMGPYTLSFAETLERTTLKGSALAPAFLEEERARAKERATVALDLDETLAAVDPKTGLWALRPGIEAELRSLQERGLRIVLWSANGYTAPQGLFRQHPALLDYFDLIISGGNYLLPVGDRRPELMAAYTDIPEDQVLEYYGLMPYKDIAIFGYALIIDNGLEPGAENSPLGPTRVLRIPSFLFGKPDNPTAAGLAETVLDMLKRPAGLAAAPAAPADVPALVQWLRDSGNWRLEDTEDVYRRKLAQDPESVLILKHQGRVLGMAVTAYDPWTSLIRRVAVDPAQRGRGLGRMLLEEAQRRLTARGTERIRGYLAPSDDSGRAFFARQGYEQRREHPIPLHKSPAPGPSAATPGVRGARTEDVARLLDLDLLGPGNLPAKIAFDPDSVLVFERDGQILGLALLLYDPQNSIVWHVAVGRENRRRGVAAALLAEAERRLAARGAAALTAYADPMDSPMMSLLKKLGYRESSIPVIVVDKPLP